MTEDEEQEARELWRVAQQAVREAFARPTEACPDAMRLLRYALRLVRQQDAGALPEELKAIGRHKAFCGYCARRFRVLQGALAAGVKARLLLSTLIRATDLAGRRLLRELGERITQAIDTTLRPQAVPVTLGAVRTRGAIVTRGAKWPEVRAQLLDRNGQPTQEFAVLRVNQGLLC